ncbi:hypothetical protein [Actinoplanes solisilvae]|uniref:hypothetical protein n=1 Tax=Actinoplanes solisilvae TaxID=2486853 RepID=UPI000FDBBC20|nr:hypothetical protein [Actinoplanes solisilvae]
MHSDQAPTDGTHREPWSLRRRLIITAAVAVVLVASGGTALALRSGNPSPAASEAAAAQSAEPAPTPGRTAPSAPVSPSASLGPATSLTSPSASPTAKPTSAQPVVPAPARARFPGAGNTGVPKGVKLKKMKGEIIVKKAGTVIDGIDLVGSISVQANNVTIKRSRITAPPDLPNKGRDSFTVVHQYTSVKGLKLQDCEIDGSKLVYRAVMGSDGVHLQRCELRNIGHGVEVGDNYIVEDSWIHSTDDGPDDDWHVDGIISSIGNNGIIRRNTITLTGGSLTGAVSVGSSIGAIDNVVIRDNLLAGGNYTVYVQDQGHPATRIQVIDNWFSTSENPKVGVYGIWYQSQLPADLVRRGNKIFETGQPADDEPDWG